MSSGTQTTISIAIKSNLKASKCALNKTLSSYSHRDKTAENQMQTLILWLAEWQLKMNFYLHRLSTFKVRAMTGKEWDPANWDGDAWGDLDEAGDTKSLNSDESSLPVEEAYPCPGEAACPAIVMEASPLPVVVASPSPPERINPALPEKTLRDSSEATTTQDNECCSPQESPSFPLFASKPLDSSSSRPLKVKYKMWPMERYATLKRNYLSFLIYRDRN